LEFSDGLQKTLYRKNLMLGLFGEFIKIGDGLQKILNRKTLMLGFCGVDH
jgi:hypothetical protein